MEKAAFPARAGMNHTPQPVHACSFSVPRPRGDEPPGDAGVNGNRKLLIFGNRKLHTSEKGAGTGVTPFGWFRGGERGWTEGA